MIYSESLSSASSTESLIPSTSRPHRNDYQPIDEPFVRRPCLCSILIYVNRRERERKNACKFCSRRNLNSILHFIALLQSDHSLKIYGFAALFANIIWFYAIQVHVVNLSARNFHIYAWDLSCFETYQFSISASWFLF